MVKPVLVSQQTPLDLPQPIESDARKAKFTINDVGFTVFAAAIEFSVTVLIAAVTGVAYHAFTYSDLGKVSSYVMVGCLAALFYMLPFLIRDEYRMHTYAELRRNSGRHLAAWNYAFLAVALIGFLTKATVETSRGWIVLFYVVGLITPLAVPAFVAFVLRRFLKFDRVSRRRVMLIGIGSPIEALARQIQTEGSCFEIGAVAVLTGADAEHRGVGPSATFSAELKTAAAKARGQRIDDVVICTEWSRDGFIAEIVECFVELPLAIHLAASPFLGSCTDAGFSRLSGIKVISLMAPPLAPLQVLSKRMFDIIVSGSALVLLAPFLAIVACVIKLTSTGPVFFRQSRSGYNCEEFRIWKFRTMTTQEDGDRVVQAHPGDARITQVGRYLRRLNIDELPQLINVLRGEMSIVGPRPHAVKHDAAFAAKVSSYSRRLNVPPGITGWAQVNGHRGPTQNDIALKERIEHDFYYIDNWSISFDLYIIALTVFSPKSYRNAF